MMLLHRTELLKLHEEYGPLYPDYAFEPIQLGMKKDPWRVIVCSILLRRSHRETLRKVLQYIFHYWPNPDVMAKATVHDLSHAITPLGQWVMRARALQNMSERWLSTAWADARDLPGVGPYVADCVGLFCFGCTELTTQDAQLKKYISAFGE